MSTKHPRPAASDPSANPMLAPLNVLADLPRRQLALATRSASALFRASETIRTIQQQAAHRALAHHDEAAERLSGPCDFNDVMAIQAQLLQFNMQEATHYWQQLMTAGLKMQLDMAGSAGRALETEAEPTLDSLQKAFEASLNGTAAAAPMTH